MKNDAKKPNEVEGKKGLSFVRRDFLRLLSFAGLSAFLPGRASAEVDYRNDKNVPNNTYKIAMFPVFIFAVRIPF